MALTVEVDTSELKPLFEALRNAPRVILATTRAVMRRAMIWAEARARAFLTNDLLKVRSGHLRASIGSKVESDALTIYGRLGLLTPKGGQVLVYGAVHEFGTAGPIAAKKGMVFDITTHRYRGGGLYIPVADNLTPTLQTRLSPTAFFEAGGFVTQSKKGNVVGLLRDGTAVRQMFVLKDAVPPLPAQHYLGNAVADVLPYIAEAIGVTLGANLVTGAAAGLEPPAP